VRYYADDLSGMLPEGQVGVRALPYDTLTLALDEAQFDGVFGGLTTSAPTLAMMQSEGGYVYEAGPGANDGSLWLQSGRAVFEPSKFLCRHLVHRPVREHLFHDLRQPHPARGLGHRPAR